MWAAILVTAAGVVAAVLIKLFDLIIEGRGSWSRRSIAADVELLKALPDELRETDSARALRARIEQSLLTFGIKSEDADDPKAAERKQLAREGSKLEAGLMTVGLFLMSVALVISWPWAEDDTDVRTEWLLSVAAVMVVGVLTLFTAGPVSRLIVRLRWKMAGRQLPPAT